jgi:hypothetical protein
MKANNITRKDFIIIIPASLALGALLASIQPGNWIVGFASFSFLSLFSFSLFTLTLRWANAGRTLTYILALTFLLRLAVGVTLHLVLPVYGHADEDDQAGYVFTDAHTRDDQAWKLASSDRPILEAFNKKYSSDQYGGLLAFNALLYRYLSPDAQRPFLLILFSAFFAALGVPFLWKAVSRVIGENVAWAAAWMFALYPESILLGAYAMREPYLLTFSAFALWGFSTFGVQERAPGMSSQLPDSKGPAYFWLGLGIAGMMLVSTPAALITIVIFAGWWFFAHEKRQLSWTIMILIAAVFVFGLVFLSLSLNRSGQFDASSPLSVVNGWLKSTISLTAYRAEGESGWVQKILGDRFGDGGYEPSWYRLPFITGYGVFQPVLPATLIYPTKPIWKIIGIARAAGWYALLPMLLLSFVAAAGSGRNPASSGSVEGSRTTRSIILWLSLVTWLWILLAALRAGGDLWDNPRYRAILFVWQSILAGFVWVWWRETRNGWFWRLLACEGVFLVIFTQWYANRYLQVGFQLPFAVMVSLIVGLWGLILGVGWWRDRSRA